MASFASWCHVKYVKEGVTVNVPTGHIKDVAEDGLSPQKLKVNNIYWVYWSPIPDETPKSVMRKGNVIIKVDDLADKERERRIKSNGGPLKGYYKAMLLDIKSTEDSFDDVSSVRTTSKKRIIKPSSKIIDAAEALAGKTSATSSAVKPGKSQANVAAQEASRKNIMDLLETCGSGPPKKVEDRRKDPFEDSPSDSEDTKSAEYWKRKFNEEKEKNSLKKKKESKSESKKSSEQTNSNSGSENLCDAAKPGSSESNISGTQPTSDSEQDEFDDESFKIIKKRRTKPGAGGDSLFVMNEALRQWGHEKVAIRCPTGIAQLRQGSHLKTSYPKMTPEKVKVISDRLKQRIVSEGVDKKQLRQRMSKLQYYLGQRVSSSRRALRNKGIQIPTPEEVADATQDDQSSDGLAAYQRQEKEGNGENKQTDKNEEEPEDKIEEAPEKRGLKDEEEKGEEDTSEEET